MMLQVPRGRRWTTALRIFIFLFFVISFIDVLRVRHAQTHHRQPNDQENNRNTRLFVVSTHWNTEHVLRNHWNSAILELVEYFGPKNVYISIYEGGSWDNTKGALRELDSGLERLGVDRKIVLDDKTHEFETQRPPSRNEPGWIQTPRGKKELRRIPYLADVRNKALEPLAEMAAASPPRKFDRILFLNDVYFSIPQLIDLLTTNDGRYAAACALDFSKPPEYYDTFALRDSAGDEPMMHTWPYFRSSHSLSAIKRNADVPVSSCWNGMVAMEAEPFYDKLSPLRFRGINDKLAESHLEGSECCLVHADNPYTPSRGVWLNPRVRVGYNGKAYLSVKDDNWLSSWDIMAGVWKNRLLRWTTTSWFTRNEVQGRLQKYDQSKSGKAEVGEHCLINEMQVLVPNGWAHV